MFAYYFVYFSSILLMLSSIKKDQKFFVFWVIMTLLIGLKFEIGADWGNYLNYLDNAFHFGYFDILNITRREFLYDFINKLSYDLGFGITGVNFFIGMITSYGFIRLVYKENFHFLIIAIFFATLLIFNLSANRQALSLGLVFWAWSLMNDNSKSIFKINVLFFMASTIHISAVFPWFLSIFANSNLLSFKRYRFFIICTGIVVGLCLLPIVFNRLPVMKYYDHSHAALVRLFLNVVPAIIFLSNQKRFKNYPDYNLLYYLSLTAIGLLFVGYFYSTTADRLGYYCVILQPIVLSRFALFLPLSQRLMYLFFVFISYTLVFFTVMNFSLNRLAFVPYKLMLFGTVFSL